MSNIFIADGDSITAGTGPMTPYFSFLTLSPKWLGHNKAVAGRTTADMLAAAPTSVDPLYSSGAKDVIAIMGGTNDCDGQGGASVAWSNLTSYASARHAVGWKVIVLTVPNHTVVQTCTDTLNALIRNNWSGIFDALADIASNANLGADNASLNTTYFLPDALHPNTFSEQTIMTPLVQAQLNSF